MIRPIRHRSARPVRAREGFTLLELVLAITIFALISVAVLAVFRTGTRTYNSSHREMALLQRSRYAYDVLEKDLMNVFYRDETSYNVQARKTIEEYHQLYLDSQRSGDWDEFERRYGPGDERRRGDDGGNHIGNPFEQLKLIDLQFVGDNAGETDRISFAVHSPLGAGTEYRFWGLARVQYSVEGDFLLRGVETIATNPRTWDNQELPKPEGQQFEIVAEGVRAFDLTYAFWWDNQWYETPSWNSGTRLIRNSQFRLGEYDKPEESEGSLNLPQPGSPGWNNYVNEQEDQPLDRLPAYVRVRLVLVDPANPGRTREAVRIFRVPNSLETWTPDPALVEEDREMESAERDKKYTPVYPGALKKK